MNNCANITPSTEQQEIILSCQTHNLIIDSVAGSGKTTTNMFIAHTYPEQKILLLTYNAKLKLETREKAKEWGLTNIEVHSYHSFCVKYYSKTAFTDAGITNFLSDSTDKKKIKKNAVLQVPFKYDIIVIDEAQDMSNTYFSLVCRIWQDNNKKDCKLIICGDVNQCIFRFNGADSRYISLAESVYCDFKPGVQWKTLRLATSFRCPIEVTQFVNKCVLKSDRMFGVRNIGYKPRYVVCDTFGYTSKRNPKTSRPYQEVMYYLNQGYKYEEIFIIAPSIKAGSGNSPVRRLANALSMAGIPIFAPASDDDKLDEDVCRGKLVFASFHQVKGLERKAVIIFNFDASYFKYYSKDSDPKICPNEIYVALTRTKERLTMFHHVGNDVLHFLDINHKYIDYECKVFEYNSDNFRQKSAIEKPQELAVTQLISHMSESTIARAMEFFTITRIRNKASIIKINSKTEQGALTESVAELNGLLIPAVYEYRTMGSMGMYNLMKMLTPVELQKQIQNKINKSEQLYLNSIPNLLELSNIWNATKTGFIFKVKQITKYDWLTDSELDACISRLETLGLSANPEYVHYEYYLHNQGSRELYNRKLHGYADYVDDHRLIEFKCVNALEPVHFIQLALYMYLAKIENQRSMIAKHGRKSIQYIKPGDTILINLFPEPEFGVQQNNDYMFSDIITGVVITVEPGPTGTQYIVSEGDDKIHDLRSEHIIMNLSWAKSNNLIQQYTYYLYNILTDELFTINGELGKLRQMVDYLIYQKYYNNHRKTDFDFLLETQQISQKNHPNLNN